MIQTAITAINVCACAVVLAIGLFGAINRMSHKTCNGMRLAWVAITTGAAGSAAAPLVGLAPPTMWGTLLHVGLAVFLIFDRRRVRTCGESR